MKALAIGLLVPVLMIGTSACDDDHHDHEHDYDQHEFVDWEGSVNGEWVVDATGDEFRFLSDDGSLVFGRTIYDNVYVSTYGDLYWEDELIGAVELVESVDGYPIAALVGTDGNFLDFFGPEHDLAWQNTDLEPVFIWDLAAHVAKPAEDRSRSTPTDRNPAPDSGQTAKQKFVDRDSAMGRAFLARR